MRRAAVEAMFLLAGFLAIPAMSVSAGQMYKYVDKYGNVHFVDDARKIPRKYRDDMEQRKMRDTRGSVPAGESAAGEAGEGVSDDCAVGAKPGVDLTGLPEGTDPATVVGRDETTGRFILDPGRPERLRKECLERKELEKKRKLGQVDDEGHNEAYWRQRMSECRAKLRDLEQKHREINSQYQASANFGQPGAGKGVETMRQRVEQQRAECDRIPREARDAGAPPGWVR